jgi:hypothetical protein
MKIYTTEEIKKLLLTNNKAVERALIALNSNYFTINTEKNNKITLNTTEINFINYILTWLYSGNHLTGYFLEKGKNIALNHLIQLTKIANKEI